MAHGNEDKALQILAHLENKDRDDSIVQLQRREIKYSVDYERTNSVRWGDILRGRADEKAGTSTVRRLVLGMGAQSFQQFSGINVTSYYLPTVLRSSVGVSSDLARLLTACNSVQYLCFSLVGIFNVERWGRWKLLILGASGRCFCYIFITALIRYIEMERYSHRYEVASPSVAFFLLYYVFFTLACKAYHGICQNHYSQLLNP